jgi:hypothetical protein
MATGFVDLAALPFTLTGLLEPEQAVGSTAYLTSKGLLPPPQEGVIPETLEMLSGSLSPQGAATGGLLALGTMAGARGARTTSQTLKTAQDEAMEVAQRNAALPVEQGGLGLPANNTAMDRARAMGFDVDNPMYHGTASDFRRLDPNVMGEATGARTAREAFWTTDSPDVARTYAEYSATGSKVRKLLDDADKAADLKQWNKYDDLVRQAESLEAAFVRDYGQGQNIMPMFGRRGDLRPVNMQGRSYDDFGVSDEILEGLQNAGIDNISGLELRALDDAVGRTNLPSTHFGFTDPTAVRSRFAAFDPKRSKESDILASILAGLGLGSLSLLGAEDEEQF